MAHAVTGSVIPIAVTEEEVRHRVTRRADALFGIGIRIAVERHHHEFTSAHLLVALATLGELLRGKSFAGDALLDSGISPKNLLGLAQLSPSMIIPAGDLVTTSARRVLTIAIGESNRLNHHVVTEDHVLLGITRGGDDPGLRLFHEVGVDPDTVTKRVLDILPEQVNTYYH